MNGYPIRDLFLNKFAAYSETHKLSDEQRAAAFSIAKCKTGELGYNMKVCRECGSENIHANSCRNRHCPNCQAVKKELWVDARSAEVIDGAYYHIVFTVPAQLNSLIYANQIRLYTLLHNSSAHSVLELTKNEKYLGATPAIIQVLHTWGQELNFHPHIHSIISASGLNSCMQFKSAGAKFFIPAKVLASKFRGKFMALLNDLYQKHMLHIPDDMPEDYSLAGWDAFRHALYKLEWNVHIKKTFNGNGNAIDYLGRYAHRVAISNNRILSLSEIEISFAAKDYKTGDKKTVTLSHDEFIRRFLMHILPKGFQKIRYYGILGNAVKTKMLSIIFRLQGHRKFSRQFPTDNVADVLLAVWKFDIGVCPRCGCKYEHLLE